MQDFVIKVNFTEIFFKFAQKNSGLLNRRINRFIGHIICIDTVCLKNFKRKK